VLAIIGIISAIAIPALLGQRARARDKSAISNADSAIGDCVAQWDKGREAGSTVANIVTKMSSYINANHAKDLNPWNAATLAYASGFFSVTANTTASAFSAAMTGGSTGQVKLFVQTPTGTSPGFVGAAVKLNGTVNGSTTFRKITAVE